MMGTHFLSRKAVSFLTILGDSDPVPWASSSQQARPSSLQYFDYSSEFLEVMNPAKLPNQIMSPKLCPSSPKSIRTSTPPWLSFCLTIDVCISQSKWNKNLMRQNRDFMVRFCLCWVFFILYCQLPPPSEYFPQLSVKKCWKISLLPYKTSYSLPFEVSLFTSTTERFWHYSVCCMELLKICLLTLCLGASIIQSP